MDFRLPSLNGIEAARQIRELSPTSRIIFVSQESSAEVVQEAFRVRALGYVFKTQAGVDLLPAVDALSALRFVSEGLAGLVPPEWAGKQPASRFHQRRGFRPGTRHRGPSFLVGRSHPAARIDSLAEPKGTRA